MSIAEIEAVEGPLPHWEIMLRALDDLNVPEGWRAEIIEGEIIVVAPPDYEHSQIVWLMTKALTREVLREGSALAHAEVHQTQDLKIPRTGSMYFPDLMVLPESAPDPDAENPAADAILVMEVTSRSTAKRDRKAKLWGYAHAGIALYLLVDRRDPTTRKGEVTLFSEPENGVYTSVVKVPFGKEIHLPEPFDLTLDTSEFPA
ncbi:Uma2 family endonuclease [Nocardiopsis aegyptia]|uniref:Uma2 family endonuclease n=1 Tax=Nocardiopsis aegyptia TaxID=220378 RepID=A0A7Z0EQ77_9ACTN|nr:Uma2 family endonuclease [Nocardiopsis aegyptia]NYJ36284.1 Uma2 family endonuclease [Nocardiopsis aegyptia]